MVDLKKINLTDINPADYNPRVMELNEFNKLSNSISEYGLVDPILINLKNNKIIGGHQRYDVLMEEYRNTGKYSELVLFPRGDIGWVFTDEDLTIKSEDHEKGLNIALNKISGEWDYPKLNELLDGLNNSPNFDINLTGFDNLDLNMEDLDNIDLGDDNLNDSLGSLGNGNFELLVLFKDGVKQEELYTELTERGFKCKMRY